MAATGPTRTGAAPGNLLSSRSVVRAAIESGSIQSRKQLLARPELRCMGFIDLKGRAGPRMATRARIASSDGESTEAAQFHAPATRQRFRDLCQDYIQNPLDVTPQQMRIVIGNPLKQFRSNHFPLPPSRDGDCLQESHSAGSRLLGQPPILYQRDGKAAATLIDLGATIAERDPAQYPSRIALVWFW